MQHPGDHDFLTFDAVVDAMLARRREGTDARSQAGRDAGFGMVQ